MNSLISCLKWSEDAKKSCLAVGKVKFKMQKSKFLNLKFITLILGLILLLALAIYSNQETKNIGRAQISNSGELVEEIAKEKLAVAEEIYPLFFCPCCGQPLDKNNVCCDMAKERIDYIDSLTAAEKTEKEVILSFVKKYGLNSFIDEAKAKEIKEELAKTAPTDRPQIIINPETYDFGNVSQKQGIVTTFFELKNIGQSDLIINKLETSCGCTSASIIYQDQEGPKFNMPGHGINEGIDNWQIAIAPGTTAQLKVYYDPDVHPDFRGAATREIYIYSNDPIDFQKKVKIELNQTN